MSHFRPVSEMFRRQSKCREAAAFTVDDDDGVFMDMALHVDQNGHCGDDEATRVVARCRQREFV